MGGSILAYKLGFVGVVTSSAIITYQLLTSQLGRSRMLAAMVLLTVFFTRGKVGNWIGYNELTALFYIGGAALLFYGLSENRKLLIGLAGVVLGANIFIHFPNLLGIMLMSSILLYGWAYRHPWWDVLAKSFQFLCGFTLGIALIWGMIVLYGHQAIYFQGFRELFGIAIHTNSHHAGSGHRQHLSMCRQWHR